MVNFENLYIPQVSDFGFRGKRSDEELALPDDFIKIIQGVIRDAEKGKIEPKKPALEEEKEVLKLYSERLVTKLEKNVLDLEREITERKRAEDALQESEENFRALAENASDGILIATGEGVHVYANKRAAEITGYSVAELLGINMKDLAHPDEFKKLAERLQKRLTGE